MRRFAISLALVVGFSFQTGQISAASIKTYAHVNIVPGANAFLVTPPGSNSTTFALSGSAMQNVSVQVTTPDADTELFNTLHDTQGMQAFAIPPAFLDTEKNLPSDHIITVVFE